MSPETEPFKFLDSLPAMIIVIVAVLGFVSFLAYLAKRPPQ